MRRILVLLNARAGTLLDSGTEHIKAALTDALAPRAERLDIHLLKPRNIHAAVMHGRASDYDTIIIGGGDGSVNCAAGALAGSDKTLAVLPFGTVYLLGRDLGMPADIDAAIAALATAQPRRIDLALVNNRMFHSLSGIGFFSQMARAREEMRGHPLGRFLGFGLAALRALRRSGRFTLELEIDGRAQDVDALAVLVTNNQFGPDWRRPRLDRGLLEVHIAEDSSALGMLKATTDLLTGNWRESPGIRSIVARQIVIRHTRRRVWTATDGELTRERVPLHYAVRPQALTVLMATNDQIQAAPSN
jgi:diacylglycerol kinase family enzyme